MLVKFPLVLFAPCLLCLQLLLHGSFYREEVKQLHCRDTQRLNIKNDRGPPEAPDHLSLATLPVCQKSGTTVARTSLKNTACLSTCWCSLEPAVSKKYCMTDIWLSCRPTKGSALSSATSPSRQGSATKILIIQP